MRTPPERVGIAEPKRSQKEPRRAPGTPLNLLVHHGDHCYFPEAVRETEEVVPVNVSTWVLPSGVKFGR